MRGDNDLCERISGLLVDYSDGELGEEDARRVAEHLLDCADCRAEHELLNDSLNLAREVWLEPPVPTSVPQLSHVRTSSRPPIRRVAAAVLTATVLLAWLGYALTRTKLPDVVDVPRPAAAVLELAEVEQMIEREVRAAQSEVSARILADLPGSEVFEALTDSYLQVEPSHLRDVFHTEPTDSSL
jgi:anti-sigma factor RsiW